MSDSSSPDFVTGRSRVSAAVLQRDGREILLVQHRRKDGTSYWQLPGGGVLPGEMLETAVLRELYEETGLTGCVIRWLFTIPYRLGHSTTFLVEVETNANASLGIDPEEQEHDFQKLAAVAWWPVAEVQSSPEVAVLQVVLGYLEKICAPPPASP